MLWPLPAPPGLTHLVGDQRATVVLPSLAGADLHLGVSRCPGAAGGVSSAGGSVTGPGGEGPSFPGLTHGQGLVKGGPAEPQAGEEHPTQRATCKAASGGLFLQPVASCTPPVPLVPPGLSKGGLSPWGQDGLGTDGKAEQGRTPPTTLGPWTVWKGDRPCWPPVPGPEWPQQVCPGAPASGWEAGLAGPLLIGEVGADPFLPCSSPRPGFTTHVQSLWAQMTPPQDADPPGTPGARGHGCRVSQALTRMGCPLSLDRRDTGSPGEGSGTLKGREFRRPRPANARGDAGGGRWLAYLWLRRGDPVGVGGEGGGQHL